jgi:hypothetical protein
MHYGLFFIFNFMFSTKYSMHLSKKNFKKNPNLLFNVVLLFIYLYMHAYIYMVGFIYIYIY